MYKKIALLLICLGLYVFIDGELSSLLFSRLVTPNFDSSEATTILRLMWSAMLAYGFYLIALRIFANEKRKNITLKEIARQFLLGMGLSLVILCVWLLLDPETYTAKHPLRLSAIAPMLDALAMFIGAGVLEEVLYRGLLQRFFSSFLPVWIATVIQVAIFVRGHNVGYINDSYSFYRAADLAMTGILLTILASKSRYLIVPIAFHIGENFFTGLFNGVQDLGLGHTYLSLWDFNLYLHSELRIILTGLMCIGVWYWMYGRKAGWPKPVQSKESITEQSPSESMPPLKSAGNI